MVKGGSAVLPTSLYPMQRAVNSSKARFLPGTSDSVLRSNDLPSAEAAKLVRSSLLSHAWEWSQHRGKENKEMERDLMFSVHLWFELYLKPVNHLYLIAEIRNCLFRAWSSSRWVSITANKIPYNTEHVPFHHLAHRPVYACFSFKTISKEAHSSYWVKFRKDWQDAYDKNVSSGSSCEADIIKELSQVACIIW